MSEDYKFERLREALAGGKAEDIIAGVIDGAGAFQAALDELTAWYGGSDREMERQQRELLALARVSNERDVGGLEKLAIKLRNLLINMNSYGIQPGRDLYLSVSEKLPRSLLLRFVETFDDSSSDIHVLSDWLLDQVRKFRHVDQRLASVTEPRLDSRHKKPVTYERSERHVQRTYAATAAPDGSRQAKTYLCLKCNAPHRLEDCKEFKAMSDGKRWELIKSKPLACAVCFKSGHWSSECYCKGCSSCQRKHHQLLHIDERKQAVSRSQQQPSHQDHSGTAQSDKAPAPNDPIARRTPLGWVCFGGAGNNYPTLATIHSDTATSPRLEELVERLWSTESSCTKIEKETPSADDQEVERLTRASLPSGRERVKVGIPWISANGQPQVTSNRPQAQQRLLSLEKSLEQRPPVHERYKAVMASHLEKGYVRQVPSEEAAADGNQQWYLPHFPVVREDKATTKV